MGNPLYPGHYMLIHKKYNVKREYERPMIIILLFYIPVLFADKAKRFLSIVELNVTVDRELSMTRFFSDVSIVSLLCDW